MHDIQKIIDNALNYLKAFYPNAEQVQVDEMEYSSDKKLIYITIGYEVAPSTPSELLSVKKTVCFKIFEVETKTGDVMSMKNRHEY